MFNGFCQNPKGNTMKKKKNNLRNLQDNMSENTMNCKRALHRSWDHGISKTKKNPELYRALQFFNFE